jgi:hypothetical protein
MTRIVAVAAVSAGFAGLWLSSTAGATVGRCSYPPESFGPRNDRQMNISSFSVRNMSCSAAHRAISRGRLLRNGNISTRGFACSLLKRYRVRGTVLGADIRCTSGGRVFRFSWAT